MKSREYIVTCCHCNKSQEYLLKDLNKIPKKPQKICDYCGKKFAMRIKKTNKKLEIDIISPAKFKIMCYHCEKVQDYMIRDLNKIPKKPSKKCKYCNKHIFMNAVIINNRLEVTACRLHRINCSYCGITFIPRNNKQLYCSAYCSKANYREKNKEKIAAYLKDYRIKNKEIIQEYGKNYFINVRKKSKEYNDRKTDPKIRRKILSEQKKYREKNKSKLLKNRKKYIKKIFDECQKGIMRDTQTHTFFDYLNKHPNTSVKELSSEFPKSTFKWVKMLHWEWKKITDGNYMDIKKKYNVTCYHCLKTIKYKLIKINPLPKKPHTKCSFCGGVVSFVVEKKNNNITVKTIKEVKKTCECCKRVFTPNVYYQRYCSSQCRERHYFQNIYDDCDKGIKKKTRLHRIFNYLNNNPKTSNKELIIQFFTLNSMYVSFCHSMWTEFTYEKYVKRIKSYE